MLLYNVREITHSFRLLALWMTLAVSKAYPLLTIFTRKYTSATRLKCITHSLTATGQANILYNKFENFTLEVTHTSPRGEYVKTKESAPRQQNGTQGSLCLAPANQLAANKQPLWYSTPSTFGVLCFKRWSNCLHVLFRGYPAKRALSAMASRALLAGYLRFRYYI